MLAADGEEGIRIAELLQVDLVLLDIRRTGSTTATPSPRRSGRVRTEARPDRRGVGIRIEDRNTIIAAGFDGYIQQPDRP